MEVSNWLLFNPKWFFSNIMAKTRWDDFHFVLDQHTLLDIYSASSLKLQFVGSNVASLWHIILILSQLYLSSYS
jgi:hypothetical protein